MTENTFSRRQNTNKDYIGADGLLYCGDCHTAKEAYFPPDFQAFYHKKTHPIMCKCRKEEHEKYEQECKSNAHKLKVEHLKAKGFPNKKMKNWTFSNSNKDIAPLPYLQKYVANWESMKAQNKGLLFWGRNGSGKSYCAGCIANALMDQEIPVYMTSFPHIVSELSRNDINKNQYISDMCSTPLLILDDLGAERNSEFGQELVYNIIDTRYLSQKPLIITTNLSVDALKKPVDMMHARIYDRVLEMCSPIKFEGNFRQENAKINLEELKTVFNLIDKDG